MSSGFSRRSLLRGGAALLETAPTGLSALLARTGWRPVAAWWFGLDAYELLVQLAHRLDDEGAVARLAHAVLALQPALDEARLCDDLVVCAVRAERP